jgi:hypothetical protein
MLERKLNYGSGNTYVRHAQQTNKIKTINDCGGRGLHKYRLYVAYAGKYI